MFVSALLVFCAGGLQRPIMNKKSAGNSAGAEEKMRTGGIALALIYRASVRAGLGGK
jgi:hypothetical protein